MIDYHCDSARRQEMQEDALMEVSEAQVKDLQKKNGEPISEQIHGISKLLEDNPDIAEEWGRAATMEEQNSQRSHQDLTRTTWDRQQ